MSSFSLTTLWTGKAYWTTGTSGSNYGLLICRTANNKNENKKWVEFLHNQPVNKYALATPQAIDIIIDNSEIIAIIKKIIDRFIASFL